MKHHLQKRLRLSIGTLLLLTMTLGILLGLFWPRTGTPFSNCVGDAGGKVWIGVPTDKEILDHFKSTYPSIELVDNPMIVKEKIFEEIMPCNFMNFNGQREVHWVRFRADVYYTDNATTSLPVYFEYDHFHLNGGGCSWKNAK